MKTNMLLASAALISALVTGSASAQKPIGTITVSDADLPYVASYCESMSGKSVQDANEDGPTLTAELATPNVQLSSLTYSDCEKAGLL